MEVKYNKEISHIQLESTQKYRSQTEIEEVQSFVQHEDWSIQSKMQV